MWVARACNTNSLTAEIIALETKRISESLNKSYLDCEDIVKLTGLGRNNVRLLMNSRGFPVLTVGNRKVVSIVNFVSWQMLNQK